MADDQKDVEAPKEAQAPTLQSRPQQEADKPPMPTEASLKEEFRAFTEKALEAGVEPLRVVWDEFKGKPKTIIRNVWKGILAGLEGDNEKKR